MLAIFPHHDDQKQQIRHFASGLHDQEGIHGDKTVMKINHNARERDRRKRINTLYSTLRTLLPVLDDESRKLSIPETVSRVLKYIPQLQKEVKRLTQKKETLIISSNISSNKEQDLSLLCDFNNHHIRKRIQSCFSSATVLSTRISDREIVVQISTPRVEKGSFCEAIMNLEEDFIVLNASCFESFEEKMFYNLHLLQAQGSHVMDPEVLEEKIWPFHEQGEKIILI